MPTPMFKVLAQSLRLGQPPDATSAVRVLVEAIEKQSAEIEDLRAKLAIAQSRMQYAEARLGRIIEASEPDLAREDAPPSSLQPHPEHAGLPQPTSEPARGSQRPPPMPAAHPAQAMSGAAPAAQPQRSPSVRPPAIPHALPIPQAPGLPQGLTNPHPPLNIPQPMPLPPVGGAPPAAHPPAPHQASLAQQSAILQQMAQPPLMPQATPPGGQPAIPRSPAFPKIPQQKVPKLSDLVEDAGFDEFNQTLVINKRDVQQVAREAPFPMSSRGGHADRSRANTAGTPFMHPGAAAPAPPAQAAPQAPSARQPAPQPASAAQDGTKTGIHPHRPEAGAGVSSALPPRPGIDPELSALASTNIMDDDAEGSDADFTLTDQTARVDLSGLNELEEQARMRPRAPRDGD